MSLIPGVWRVPRRPFTHKNSSGFVPCSRDLFLLLPVSSLVIAVVVVVALVPRLLTSSAFSIDQDPLDAIIMGDTTNAF